MLYWTGLSGDNSSISFVVNPCINLYIMFYLLDTFTSAFSHLKVSSPSNSTSPRCRSSTILRGGQHDVWLLWYLNWRMLEDNSILLINDSALGRLLMINEGREWINYICGTNFSRTLRDTLIQQSPITQAFNPFITLIHKLKPTHQDYPWPVM